MGREMLRFAVKVIIVVLIISTAVVILNSLEIVDFDGRPALVRR